MRVFALDIIHRPEVVRPDFAGFIPVPSARKGLQMIGRRSPAHRGKGIGIAGAVKGQGVLPAVVGSLSIGIAVIKQFGHRNAVGILNDSVAEANGQAECAFAVSICIAHIERISIPLQLA